MSKAIFSFGEWIEGTGDAFGTVSPLNGASCWYGNAADGDQVAAVIERAVTVCHYWASLSLQRRIAFVEAFGKTLEAHSDALALRISKEIGKPFWEAKQEVQAMVQKIPASIAAYEDRCPTREKVMATGVSVTRHRPHGVVGVLGPYNFPGHIPNGHIIPALIAGNVVVFKPSDKAAFVSEYMVSLWQESGLPEGVLSMVQGGVDTALAVVDHPEVRAIFFTGSSHVGSAIEARCMGSGKLLALEMGGNNPLIIHSYEDVTAAVLLTIQSAFLSAGQRCTSARRLLVVENEHTHGFLDCLLRVTRTLAIGEGNDVFMGAMVSEQATKPILAQYDYYLSHGAKVLKPLVQRGAFLEPGILDVSAIPILKDEECFGPLLLYKKMTTFESALHEANATRFGLSASVITQDFQLYEQALSSLKAGIINWNAPTIGANGMAPFGGLGLSGNFRPSAYYAADYCSYPVASMQSATLNLPATLPPGVFL